MEKKKSIGIVVALVVSVVLILLFGGYIVYDKVLSNVTSNDNTTSDNTNNDNDSNSIVVNKKYENVYAFKFYNDSIYALRKNEANELLMNYKDKICGTEECGIIEYEYIDGKLYLYHVGYQDSTYNINEQKNIEIYSIDLTQKEITLEKVYEISKKDRYVESITQGENSIYYISYLWNDTLNCYDSKVFEFSKSSKEIKEIYDFKGYVDVGDYRMFKQNNNHLYIGYDISYGEGSTGVKKILDINLNDYSNKIIQDNLFIIYYDNAVNKVVAKLDNPDSKLKVIDLNNFSNTEIEENTTIDNRFYSISNLLVYYVDAIKTVKIVGDKSIEIDLSKYATGKIKDDYTRLVLSDDYSVIALVYLENETFPKTYKINLQTAKVSNIDIDLDEILSSQYLYIN